MSSENLIVTFHCKKRLFKRLGVDLSKSRDWFIKNMEDAKYIGKGNQSNTEKYFIKRLGCTLVVNVKENRLLTCYFN